MFVASRRSTSTLLNVFRKMSSSSNSANGIKVDLDSQSGIAVVKWNRKPVNGLTLTFIENNLEVFKSLKMNSSCRGVILTSEIPNIFCAGLDLKEFLKMDRKAFMKHRSALVDLLQAYRFGTLPMVAAINGHAPAGGCVISMATDYRVMMSGVGTIGLNESAIGLILPDWISLACKNLLGHRKAELAILLGTLFRPDEALAIGLVDELATDENDLMRRAQNQIVKLASIPSTVYHPLKISLGQDLLDAMKEGHNNPGHSADQMMAARVRIQEHLENLRNKKKAQS